jgi:hypothetical protein
MFTVTLLLQRTSLYPVVTQDTQLTITRTIWVSYLSWFLLLLLPSRQICNGRYTRTRAPTRNINPASWQISGSDQTCTATLRKYSFVTFVTSWQILFIYQTCTATRPASTKLVPGFAKTTPYPPCTVTAYRLKYQDRDRCCRRVTQPPHIAGPLAFIWS